MSKILVTIVLLLASIGYAFAQSTVPPRWTRSGSAVCPNNYDYVISINRCVARGFAEYRGYRGGGGVPAGRNSLGSAVCPQGYDYVAARGACFPQR